MRSRLAVVTNPTSGKGRGASAGQHTVAALRSDGYDVIDTSGPTLALALESTRKAVADGVDAVVVVGGDGMVHLGVNAVAGTSTPLSIVAVGTGNDFAAALGLPLGSVSQAVAATRQRLSGPARAVDAAIVHTEGAPHTRRVWFAGVLSAGIDATVNAHANLVRWPRGRARYVRSAARELVRFRPYGYTVEFDQIDGDIPETLAGVPLAPRGPGSATWTSPGALVAVANGYRIGGGIRIAPDAVLDDGLLDVVLAGPYTRPGILGLFPGMYAGRHVRSSGVGVIRARRVRIEETRAGAVPPPAFADGEYISPLPVTITVQPAALNILG